MCQYCGGKVVARGMCRTHYLRWYKHKDPNKLLRPKGAFLGKCDECNEKAVAKGKCNVHYQRHYRKTGVWVYDDYVEVYVK